MMSGGGNTRAASEMYGPEQTSPARWLKIKRMRKGGSLQASRHIDEQGALVVVDFRGCDSHGVSAVYQAFALLCAREGVRDALLKAGNEDADAHYALRDTLVTLARVAEIPLRFRLALVASSGPIENAYRSMQRELRSLGCDARVFRTASEARQWLCDEPEMKRPDAACAVGAFGKARAGAV